MAGEGEGVETRRQVLALIASQGPITASDLADRFSMTAAGIRRHLTWLEDHGQIAPRAVPTLPGSTARRGRPARAYVVTVGGSRELGSAYADFAVQAMNYVASTYGSAAMTGLAMNRAEEMAARYREAVCGTSISQRLGQLQEQLSKDGFSPSLRPGPQFPGPRPGLADPRPAGQTDPGHVDRGHLDPGAGGQISARPTPGVSSQQAQAASTRMDGKQGPTLGSSIVTVQLCQGHCPVQAVAQRYPQFCDAETRAFASLLGTHVQRLATIAKGAHACVTSVPVHDAQALFQPESSPAQPNT